MIKVNPSFWIVFILMILIDYRDEFLIVFFSVTCHEISHVLVAKLFGLKLGKLTITPIGEVAVIENLDTIALHKKLLIILAGPISNFVIALFFSLFFPQFSFLIYANISIGLFNLLPIYPLDGGRIINSILSDYIGILNSNKLIMKLGKILCSILLLLGMIQAALFPYNISIICISVYLRKINQQEYINSTFQFYKNIVSHSMALFLPIRQFAATKKMPIKHIVNRLCYSRYFIINIIENEEVICVLTQDKILNFIKFQGINGNIEDVFLKEELTGLSQN